MSNIYSYTDYDKYLSLKISPLLWLLIVYFLRPYVLLVSGIRMGPGGGSVKGAWGLKNMVYPDNFSLTIGIVATVPALFVIYAWVKRKPEASNFVRKIWRNGMNLLLLSAALNVLIIFIPLLLGLSHKIAIAGWVQLGTSLVIAWYLFTSRRVRDTFADFPQEASVKAMKTNDKA